MKSNDGGARIAGFVVSGLAICLFVFAMTLVVYALLARAAQAEEIYCTPDEVGRLQLNCYDPHRDSANTVLLYPSAHQMAEDVISIDRDPYVDWPPGYDVDPYGHPGSVYIAPDDTYQPNNYWSNQ